MPVTRLRLRSPAWPGWLRRTVRLRFAAIYGGLFLASGAALAAVTYVLFERATRYTKPQLPRIPHAPDTPVLRDLLHSPAIQQLLGSPAWPNPGSPVGTSVLYNIQPKLQQFQRQLAKNLPIGTRQGPLRSVVTELSRDQHQLARALNQQSHDQHQLTQAVNQLAQAVHQVARAGSAEAAQRAADSHQLLVNSGIALAIVAVLALLAGWLVAGRVLRPIRTITRKAQRISSASLHERLALDGPDDELKELGDTLDDLFGRLDAAFEAQRHFVANASHELRTPLTAERNLLQVALDDPDTSTETWRSTADELLACNDEQVRLIEALLALASGESGLDQCERTDLGEICRAVLERSGPDADRLRLQVETAIGPAPVDGDPRLVERLVANLVDNAIGHNVAGGCVQISTGAEDGSAVLSVTNTGPIIPPGEVDRLFQPFQRLDPRRTHHEHGHGLGLSIVRAIATTHHASVTAHPLPDGGLSLTVAFPPPAGSSATPDSTSRDRQFAESSS